MAPDLSSSDTKNLRRTNSICLCESLHHLCASSAPSTVVFSYWNWIENTTNMLHSLLGQFCHAVPASFVVRTPTVSNSVSSILRLGDVFQIAQHTVCLVAVSMVDLVPGRTMSQEGFYHKLMDIMRSLPVILPQHHLPIAPAINPWSQQPSGRPVTSLPARMLRATCSPDTSKIGNLVQIFVAKDGAPFFLHRTTIAVMW